MNKTEDIVDRLLIPIPHNFADVDLTWEQRNAREAAEEIKYLRKRVHALEQILLSGGIISDVG